MENNLIKQLQDMQQYNFAIGILAMLIIGFGFLMVFVKKYGFSALTGTYLITATTITLYMLLRNSGFMNLEKLQFDNIVALLSAEFAAAAALIAMGAVLGRVRVYQYIFLGILIIPAYMLVEWAVYNNGLGITKGFVDAAGSIGIHAFGAYFGIGLTLAVTLAKHNNIPVETDYVSDRFSMLGSMILWVFWPTFCSAIVSPELVTITSVNTIFALSGATIATFVFSAFFRKGKPAIADIANASLAGGVAIGATCNIVQPGMAFIIGVLAGLLCVVGYVFIQPKIQEKFRIVDTCGVHNLHGMPGLLGGILAIFVVPQIASAQIFGILLTLIIALISGLISGVIIKLTGKKNTPYDDTEEFSE